MLGNGRVKLLESILEYGSINKAAKELKLSYKKAWHQINALNDACNEPVVVRTSGGSGGGGTQVTPKGQELIRIFRKAQQETDEHFEQLTQKLSF